MTPNMNAAYAAARAAYSARRIAADAAYEAARIDYCAAASAASAAIADHEMAKKAYESKDENERPKP